LIENLTCSKLPGWVKTPFLRAQSAYNTTKIINRFNTWFVRGYVPITRFPTSNYGVCDRWFAALPADNRKKYPELSQWKDMMAQARK